MHGSGGVGLVLLEYKITDKPFSLLPALRWN